METDKSKAEKMRRVKGDDVGWGFNGRCVGGSKLSPHRELNYGSRHRCGQKKVQEVWRKTERSSLGEKKVFWRLQSLENQDAELDVAKSPKGGQGH